MTDRHESALLADANWDPAGRLTSFALDWTKAGNRLHRSWDNTILGRVAIDDRSLTATVNSKRRATRLRKQIEKRLAGRVAFLRTVTESVDALLAQARGQTPPPDAAPEVTAHFMRQHWDDWLDARVPALGHLTPREAAETPAGRERLSALLDEFEWETQAGQEIPVQRLRAALGL